MSLVIPYKSTRTFVHSLSLTTSDKDDDTLAGSNGPEYEEEPAPFLPPI